MNQDTVWWVRSTKLGVRAKSWLFDIIYITSSTLYVYWALFNGISHFLIRLINEPSIGTWEHQSIKVEVDYPSKHLDKKIPILDLKVWVEKREGVNVVLHEFYSKDISSKAVIHPRSAIPSATKRTIMTQEILRVLLNCSTLLPWEQTATHVNHIVARMQYSGYDHRFRYEVVRSALEAYKGITSRDKNGVRPMYRTKDWKRSEWETIKRSKKVNWYKEGGYSRRMWTTLD